MSTDAVRTAGSTTKDPMSRFVEQQDWISPGLQQSVQKAVSSTVDAIGGDPLRNFLYGQWMHVPLHAVLTDIPIGSWTVTVALDAFGAISGQSSLNSAADAANMVGLVAASATAITGLNDWSRIDKPEPRRLGFVHGIINVAATGLFLTSCVARRRHNRSSARAFAALGYLLITASAHLGGTLVYEHGIGVDQVDDSRGGDQSTEGDSRAA